MIRRFFVRIQPYIKPELRRFFYIILPAGMVLGLIIFLTDGDLVIRVPWKLYLLGVGLCVGGIYVMRIIAYLHYNIITRSELIKPDIYIDKQKSGV